MHDNSGTTKTTNYTDNNWIESKTSKSTQTSKNNMQPAPTGCLMHPKCSSKKQSTKPWPYHIMTNDNGLPWSKPQGIDTGGQQHDPLQHNGPSYAIGYNPSNQQYPNHHQTQTPWETQTTYETRVPTGAQSFHTSGSNFPGQWPTLKCIAQYIILINELFIYL